MRLQRPPAAPGRLERGLRVPLRAVAVVVMVLVEVARAVYRAIEWAWDTLGWLLLRLFVTPGRLLARILAAAWRRLGPLRRWLTALAEAAHRMVVAVAAALRRAGPVLARLGRAAAAAIRRALRPFGPLVRMVRDAVEYGRRVAAAIGRALARLVRPVAWLIRGIRSLAAPVFGRLSAACRGVTERLRGELAAVREWCGGVLR